MTWLPRQMLLVLLFAALSACNLFEATPPTSDDATPDRLDAGGLDADDAIPDAARDAAPDVDAVDVCALETTAEFCARHSRSCGSYTGTDNCDELRTDVNCGACPAGEACEDGLCACEPETDVELCQRIVANCGEVTATDNCDTARTVDCGGCTAPATCGGGGTANVCACSAQSDVDFCAMYGVECGVLTQLDACDAMRTVDCGECTAPESCGGGRVSGTCGCPPESDTVFCARVGGCGIVTAADNCQTPRSADCGGCPTGESCVANACVCVAETDAQFCDRLNGCDAVNGVDNCGADRTVACGGCADGGACTNNQCTCVAEDDATFCARYGVECGALLGPDNCAIERNIDCGSCPSGSSCEDSECILTIAFPPPGLDTWLRAEDGVSVNMQDKVSEWADRVTGELWTASAMSNRPTLVTGAHLGFDTVRFFGGQILQRSSSVLSSPEFTAYFVVVRHTTNREGAVLGSSANLSGVNELAFGTTDTTMRFASSSAGLLYSASVLPTTNLAVLAVRTDGTSFEVFQGVQLTASTTFTSVGDFQFDQLGGYQTFNFMRGDLYEVMLWPRALTDDEHNTVISRLRGRYGL